MAITIVSQLFVNRAGLQKLVIRVLNFGTAPSTVEVDGFFVVNPSASDSPTRRFLQALDDVQPQSLHTFPPIFSGFELFYFVITVDGPGQNTTQISFNES